MTCFKGCACCRKARHHGTTTMRTVGWGADIPGEPIRARRSTGSSRRSGPSAHVSETTEMNWQIWEGSVPLRCNTQYARSAEIKTFAQG